MYIVNDVRVGVGSWCTKLRKVAESGTAKKNGWLDKLEKIAIAGQVFFCYLWSVLQRWHQGIVYRLHC